MDGVAAEVSEEVGVLFEDRDADAGTSQEESQHHAGRSATRDHALDVHGRECSASYCTLTSWPRATPPGFSVEWTLK